MKSLVKKAAIGQTNCVLIFDRGSEKIAIVTQLSAYISNLPQSNRINFKGDFKVSEKIHNHIINDVLPIFDGLMDLLGLSKNNFELSLTNPGAFSSHDMGAVVSGNSMDLPLFLTMLSSCLQIPIDQDIISTGYISSINGKIGMVYGLPEKLKAAEKETGIKVFIHPEIKDDNSLEMLTPNEKCRIEGAIAESKKTLRPLGVCNIFEAIKNTYNDEQIVFSSLNNGFFEMDIKNCKTPEMIFRTAKYFCENNQERLWLSLERQLINGRCDYAKELLLAFTRYNTDRRFYPEGFGTKLFNLIASIPPNIRQSKIKFPLLPILECIDLSQFAIESNQEDIVLLLNVCTGEKFRKPSGTRTQKDRSDIPVDSPDSDLLETILSKINVDALTKNIVGPIEAAHACFMLDSITVESSEQFNHTIVSYYIHLLRHIRDTIGPVDYDAAGKKANSLVEEAFSASGGYESALSEAKHGYNGGVKHIIDRMTEIFKKKEQEEYITYILKTAFDPKDMKAKVNLIKSLLSRLKNHLPENILSQPPERYAKHYKSLVRAYVQAKDNVEYIFKTL